MPVSLVETLTLIIREHCGRLFVQGIVYVEQ